MKSDATTVEEYLAEAPEDRRAALQAVRRLVLEHLPDGFEEVMQYGMISYVVPLERCPDTYNGQPLTVISLANQKRHLALYLMGIYGEEGAEAWLRARWAAGGPKLDMGKSCLRFRRFEDLDLDVVAEAVAATTVEDLIAAAERAHGGRGR